VAYAPQTLRGRVCASPVARLDAGGFRGRVCASVVARLEAGGSRTRPYETAQTARLRNQKHGGRPEGGPYKTVRRIVKSCVGAAAGLSSKRVSPRRNEIDLSEMREPRLPAVEAA
jgi:hypothetical protein